jgi:hypothetical protein
MRRRREASRLKAEITLDLVMQEDMAFAEGCYRLDQGEWHVFTVAHSAVQQVTVKKDVVWRSGVTGLNLFFPNNSKINKSVILDVMSITLGVAEWTEVRGPDSINLR